MRGLVHRLTARRLMEELSQDVRFGLRMIVKSPAVTIVGIVTLALATGATTAIFSVVERRRAPSAAVWRAGSSRAALRPRLERRPWRHARPGARPVDPRDLDAFVRNSQSFDGFTGYESPRSTWKRVGARSA